MTATFKSPEIATRTPTHSLSFAPRVVLTKIEVFEACEWLAAAQRLLIEDGHDEEAGWLGLLFEDLEDRVAIG
jgi:hypothetical protein